MTIPKNTENWTKYPNYLLDNIEHFTGNEFKILSLLVRKIVGFQNPNKKFSKSYISKKTGIKSKHTVLSSLDSLKNMGIVRLVTKSDGTPMVDSGGCYFYDLTWQEPEFTINRKRKISSVKNALGAKKEPVQKLHGGECKNCTSDSNLPVQKLHPVLETSKEIKENIYKESKKKECINFENLQEIYKTHLKGLGKPYQDYFTLERLHLLIVNTCEAQSIKAFEQNEFNNLLNQYKIDEFYKKLVPIAKNLISFMENRQVKLIAQILSRVEEDKKRIDENSNLENYERPESLLDSLEKLKAS